MKICVWRACLDSLPTRLNLSKRCVMSYEMCVVYGGQIESTEHVFRECSLARAMWFCSLGIIVDTGHHLSLLHWLENISVQFPSNGFELCLIMI